MASGVLGGIVGIFVNLVEGILEQLNQGWSQAASSVLHSTILLPYDLNSSTFVIWSFSRGLAMAGLTVVVTYGAVRSMLSPIVRPSVEYREWLGRIIFGTLMINGSFLLVKLLLELNNAFVQAVIQNISQQQMENFFAMTISGGLMLLLISIIIIFAILYLAVSYFLRIAEIVFLLAMLPFIGALWVIEECSGLWKAAIGELVTTIFLQSGQVLVLWLFIDLGMAQQGGSAGTTLVNYLSALACFLLMAKVPGLMRSLLNSGGAFSQHAFPRELNLASLGVRVLGTFLGAGV